MSLCKAFTILYGWHCTVTVNRGALCWHVFWGTWQALLIGGIQSALLLMGNTLQSMMEQLIVNRVFF